jgi:hypothetical protein
MHGMQRKGTVFYELVEVAKEVPNGVLQGSH